MGKPTRKDFKFNMALLKKWVEFLFKWICQLCTHNFTSLFILVGVVSTHTWTGFWKQETNLDITGVPVTIIVTAEYVWWDLDVMGERGLLLVKTIENCSVVKLDTCDNICNIICRQCNVIYIAATIQCQIWVTNLYLEQFSNECLKTKTKEIYILTDKNRIKTENEPIRIQRKYVQVFN